MQGLARNLKQPSTESKSLTKCQAKSSVHRDQTSDDEDSLEEIRSSHATLESILADLADNIITKTKRLDRTFGIFGNN